MKELTLHTDGGSRGNPGQGAIGGVLLENGIEIDSFGEKIGICTNNEAEYRALIKGMELAINRGCDILTCYLDSLLVVNQLNGIYRIKESRLQAFAITIKNLQSEFTKVVYKHVERAKNASADVLVNKALDGKI